MLLINFASIRRLDILKSLFTEIVIPQSVYSDTVESGFPNSETILKGIEAGWLNVKPVEEIPESISFAGLFIPDSRTVN
ncbi:MAG: hypothetical protein JJU32_07605 [Phormidium sp. BM_Day4_Bin.17]|nr:hypothetical protein [Phormidium sp. BM_Day4_Bin.17]UCJ11578.1 MAG: hypothetical protein JWS08_17770 [Phormidium sp. PBR-2020]